ncbi:MAG TPA: hypothetical protein VGC66_15930 [Pyrinomonadaceae bacterium]|jgi:hypothetical protein
MSIYITERDFDGAKVAGQDIEANSWTEAETKAQEFGLRVIGKLDTRLMRA